MEKRFILALILSGLVLMFFQNFYKKQVPFSPVALSQAHTPSASKQEPPPIPELTPYEKPSMEESETRIETDKYVITFTNIGGSITGISLKEGTTQGRIEELILLKDVDYHKAVFSMSLLNPPFSLERSAFTLSRDNTDLIYSHVIPGRLEIQKKYIVRNSLDYIELQLFIKNISAYPIGLQYKLSGPSTMEEKGSIMGRSFFECDSKANDKIIRRAKIKNTSELIPGAIFWTAVKNRYFALVLKPKLPQPELVLDKDSKGNIYTSLKSNVAVLEPGKILQEGYALYAGPANPSRLARSNLDIGEVVNFGFFGGITTVLLHALNFLYNIFHNWGLAIIMLTILVNVVLFPLTKSSFASMRKMQAMQPHIEKLRKLHKDNPNKLNKELAELYKTNKINPFGGCLPLFLQMPIFVALYNGLMKSFELKNATFLWVKDLSSPEAVALPFKLPLIGNHINILPLLTAAAMMLQQKISSSMSGSALTGEQKQQQKIMMVFFPIFFGFLFYNFPSGLVLYWLTNTILVTAEQGMLKKAQ